MPDPDSMLAEDDVRKIVRLLGGVIAAPGDVPGKRHLLMAGLCQLVDATSWVWSVSEFHPDRPPTSVGIIKHFGVHSQSELITCLSKGDGGDR